jgi:hypothetical protein
MLQTGDIIRIREYVEIPVGHELWDQSTSRYYRSGERDLEEGLFPGLYKVVTTAYTKHPGATVGYMIVLASVRISPETNIVIPVGDDRFIVHGAKAIDTLERSIKRSVKDWRPEMGGSRKSGGFEVGTVVCLESVFIDVTFVDSRGYADDQTVIRKGFFVVVASKPKLLILSRVELDENDRIKYRSSEYYRVQGKINIREIEKAQRCWRSVKDWRPEMGISLPDRPRLFEPGTVQGTPKAVEALERAGQDPMELLERHLSGDWGDAHEDDVRENHVAIGTRDRIISVYALSTGETVVIITDPGHEMTTIMMPGEF